MSSRSRSRAGVGFCPTGWKGASKIPKRGGQSMRSYPTRRHLDSPVESVSLDARESFGDALRRNPPGSKPRQARVSGDHKAHHVAEMARGAIGGGVLLDVIPSDSRPQVRPTYELVVGLRHALGIPVRGPEASDVQNARKPPDEPGYQALGDDDALARSHVAEVQLA